MISAKFFGEMYFWEKSYAKNSNFEIFESALYMKSVSMPLSPDTDIMDIVNTS